MSDFEALNKSCDDVVIFDTILNSYLEDGGDLEAKDSQGQTILMKTCLKRNLACVKLLVYKKSNLNAQDREGHTSLALACMNPSSYEIVKLLIQAGADVLLNSANGSTPLHIACDNDCLESATALSSTIDINSKDSFGNTCLHRACSFNSIKCMHFIVSLGIDLNAQNNTGASALICAAENNNLSCVSFLVQETHVDVAIMNYDGKTVSQVGNAETRKAVHRILVEAGKMSGKSETNSLIIQDTADGGHVGRQAESYLDTIKYISSLPISTIKEIFESKDSLDVEGQRFCTIEAESVLIKGETTSVSRIFLEGLTRSSYSEIGWVLSCTANNCMLCGTGFGILKHKHHCRACGNVVCHSCSKNEVEILHFPNSIPQRVCDQCYLGDGLYVTRIGVERGQLEYTSKSPTPEKSTGSITFETPNRSSPNYNIIRQQLEAATEDIERSVFSP